MRKQSLGTAKWPSCEAQQALPRRTLATVFSSTLMSNHNARRLGQTAVALVDHFGGVPVRRHDREDWARGGHDVRSDSIPARSRRRLRSGQLLKQCRVALAVDDLVVFLAVAVDLADTGYVDIVYFPGIVCSPE